MSSKKDRCSESPAGSELRGKAEQRRRTRGKEATKAIEATTETELRSLVDELQARGAELEMQNQELARANEELAHARLAAQESSDKYRSLFEAESDAVFLIDCESGRFLDANAAALKLYGYSREELLLLKVSQLSAEPDKTQAAIATNQAYIPLRRHRKKDGTVFPVEIVTGRLETQNHRIHTAAVRDITERRLVDELLRASEADLRAQATELAVLMDSVPAITFIAHDPECRHMTSSRATRELLRVPEGISVSKSAPESERPTSFRAMKDGRELRAEELPMQLAADTGREVCNFEMTLAFEDGTSRDILGNAAPLFDESGKVRGAVGAFLDVTEKKRAQEVLLQTLAELQTVYDGIQEGLAIADVETARFLRVNPSLCRMLGYSEEELLAASVPDICPPDDVPDALQQFRAAAEGRVSIHENLPILRKDGSIFYADITAQRILYHGRPCLLGVFRDVTERRQVQESLRQAKKAAEAANRAKSEFLANMSHEIRTPMTAILGFSNLLAAPDLSESDRQRFLEGIQRNGQALLELISDILDLSRIEAERVTLEKVDCPLRQVVENVVSLARARADEKQLCLEVDYWFPLPEQIHTDPARLRQILVNLVGNAIKFTDRGGVRIAVTCLRGDDPAVRLQFAVSDTGIGIPADKIGDLFQDFMQIDASASRPYSGTGLGLAISQRLAKILGGKVEVVSELGKGSTFTLTIDAGVLEDGHMLQSLRTAEAAPEEPLAEAAQLVLHGRVLFADDVSDVAAVVSRILRKMNLEVDLADDGQVACEMAEKAQAEGRPYDLIFMDIQMPRMSGYEATRWLRQHGWQGPIVALTAHALVGDREKCLAVGCDDYLTKPLTAPALQAIVTRYLTRRADSASAGDTPAAEPAGLLEGGLSTSDEMSQLVRAFVDELPLRANRIDQAFREQNYHVLAELSHQLKGTCSVFGFPRISDAASVVYQLASEGEDWEHLGTVVGELVELSKQALSQAPSPSDNAML